MSVYLFFHHFLSLQSYEFIFIFFFVKLKTGLGELWRHALKSSLQVTRYLDDNSSTLCTISSYTAPCRVLWKALEVKAAEQGSRELSLPCHAVVN